MARTALSLKQCQQLYDRLRVRYFLDAHEPLHIPPPAAELRWVWLPDNSDALAETVFDEDDDPYEVRLSHKDARYSVIRPSLLHELTHMRIGSRLSCGGISHAWTGVRIKRSSMWHAETVRLAGLGALQL